MSYTLEQFAAECHAALQADPGSAGRGKVRDLVSQALKDPAWLGFATEGYVFSALVFFVCCFAMSAYGRSFERRAVRAG